MACQYPSGGGTMPPDPIIGSPMKAATVSGPSRKNQFLEIARAFLRERLFAHSGRRFPVVVRRRRAQDTLDRQVERLVEHSTPVRLPAMIVAP